MHAQRVLGKIIGSHLFSVARSATKNLSLKVLLVKPISEFMGHTHTYLTANTMYLSIDENVAKCC